MAGHFNRQTKKRPALKPWRHVDMTMHIDRPHSRIGPSAAHRWIECPGSVGLSDGEPNTSSVYALEGTAAHQFCEHIMQTGDAPEDYEEGRVYLGKTGFIAKDSGDSPPPNNVDVWEIDADMVEAATVYRDTMLDYIETGDIFQWESRLDISHVHPDLFGTGDAVILKHRRKTIVVGDFKYGMGIAVEPEFNEQLMTYALGQLHAYRNYKIEKIILVIIQPRAYHRDGPVRTATHTIEELKAFEKKLRKLAALTDDPDAPLKAGEWCRFCPAAYRCTTLARKVARIIGVKDVKHITADGQMPNVNKMTQADRGRVMRGLPIIESWLRRVAEKAHADAMRGVLPPGMKVVARRAVRKIIDADSMKLDLDLQGFEPDDYMAPPKLRGIGAIEALVGKKEFAELFALYVRKESTGFVLVDEYDAREAVKTDNSDAFKK